MEKHIISPEPISIDLIKNIINQGVKIELSQESIERINKCREYLDKKTDEIDRPIYGVTTGFGSLCNTVISNEDLGKLQKNLVMSHACGMGEEVPQEIVKIMTFLKIHALSLGHSGVQLKTVQRLVDFFNNDIIPVVYQLGSLGASGDLSPLAHLCLPLFGEGEVYLKDEKISGRELNEKMKWDDINLQSKEGLALLNGTQFMSSYGVWLMIESEKISNAADIIGALSLDAYDGRIEPFYPSVHKIRPHYGQLETAERFNNILSGSEIIVREKEHVQDPYSFRCIPQVHGASKDSIYYVRSVIETEINAVTDNPTIFPDEDMVVSAGNFHGQPLALVLDFLSIALAELGNISERRIYQLIAGKRGLPSFLVANPGLNSGFMIPQYTAASIVNQSKSLTMPCSSDSIESSQGQEDHVSMGANAATKAFRIAQNTERILAIELFNAAQAMEFRRPLKSSPILESMISEYRKYVPYVEDDPIMYKLMDKSLNFIQNTDFAF
ncbi:MAG: histidine ammonia-lyase [Bacteroidales bacterium]|jgi:histidine ammonia-lyase|nr:histidine ammonia-lyase [Bacteroidales bacterium]